MDGMVKIPCSTSSIMVQWIFHRPTLIIKLSLRSIANFRILHPTSLIFQGGMCNLLGRFISQYKLNGGAYTNTSLCTTTKEKTHLLFLTIPHIIWNYVKSRSSYSTQKCRITNCRFQQRNQHHPVGILTIIHKTTTTTITGATRRIQNQRSSSKQQAA